MKQNEAKVAQNEAKMEKYYPNTEGSENITQRVLASNLDYVEKSVHDRLRTVSRFAQKACWEKIYRTERIF